MTIGLLVVLVLILVLPFTCRFIEHNLEFFLFFMGIATVFLSGVMSLELIGHILSNYLLYFITGAVLLAGLVFRISIHQIQRFITIAYKKIPLKLFVFLLIVVLGLISSIITAIIAALILVEVIHALPLKHKIKAQLTVFVCFSIGLGAALTPIGEPLSTIVISTLDVDFFYLIRNVGIYIIPSIFISGIFGGFFIEYVYKKDHNLSTLEEQNLKIEEKNILKMESLQDVFTRAAKIFIFVIALELLGNGFKPLINQYIIPLDSRLLYWINMTSAVLDNATLASAEISPFMNIKQIQAILLGLLVSGSMLIPGNIPNIISAGKLNIKSREWALTGIPLGIVSLILLYFILFIF